MSTLDIKIIGNRAQKTAVVYLAVTIFCALIGAVYEAFSHGVYSYFMLYAFAFPLAGGVLPFSLLALRPYRYPNALARNLYHSGIAFLTVGSIVRGVLDIYGTTNRLAALYWYIGIPAALLGAALFFLIPGGGISEK